MALSSAAALAHGGEDAAVARAAAEVARERLADVVVGRIGLARQQRRGGDDQAGSAEAALHGAGGDERALHGMQPPVGCKALDRHDLPPVGLRAVHEARAHELAVEQHRAGAALALLAGALGARQVEPLAQHEQQALRAQHVGLPPLPLTRNSILIRGTSRVPGA